MGRILVRALLIAGLILLSAGWLRPVWAVPAVSFMEPSVSAFQSGTSALMEDFEDGILDARLLITTTGTYRDSPGTKDITNFGSSKAFGFGQSNCNWGCQDNNVTRLYIHYPAPVYVYSLSYKEMELYNNWGNGGKVYVDGVPVSDANTRELGREPYNDRKPDTYYRSRLILINKFASDIELRVRDITFESEIFLDDLVVSDECLNLPQGVVSWWSADGHPFDLLDVNDAQWLGSSAYTAGVTGKAFSFDGIDDTLRVADSPSLQAIDGQFSLEAWIKADSLPSGSPAYDMAIVEREENGQGFALATRGDSLGLWIGSGQAPGIFTSSSSVTSGSWNRLVGIYDGTTASVYLNGVWQASQVVQLAPVDLELHIGARHGSERFFQGELDEITLHNRALEGSEVLTLYQAGSAGKCRPCLPPLAGLAAWWPLDDGSGSVARELVNARNGAVEGASWAIGKAGTALSFDGLDDYLRLPDVASQVLQDAGGTISAWVNPAVLGDNELIAAFGSGQDGEGIGMGIFGQVRIFHQGEAYDWQSAVVLPVSAWTFLAYTWDDSDESIYVNGDLIESRPRNFNFIPGKARIGGGWWDQANTAFPGLVDEVQVHNRALAAEEIAALYFADCAGTCWVYHSLYFPIMAR